MDDNLKVLTNRLTTKRHPENKELLELIIDTGGLTRTALRFLTGSNSQRIYRSLAKSSNLKVVKASGLSRNSKMTIYSEKQYSTKRVLHFDRLANAVWYLREQHNFIGRVTVLDDDTILANCLVDAGYLQLQFFDINENNYQEVLNIVTDATPILVFQSIDLRQRYLKMMLDEKSKLASQIREFIANGVVCINFINYPNKTILVGNVVNVHRNQANMEPITKPLENYPFENILIDKQSQISNIIHGSYEWVIEHSVPLVTKRE